MTDAVGRSAADSPCFLVILGLHVRVVRRMTVGL